MKFTPSWLKHGLVSRVTLISYCDRYISSVFFGQITCTWWNQIKSHFPSSSFEEQSFSPEANEDIIFVQDSVLTLVVMPQMCFIIIENNRMGRWVNDVITNDVKTMPKLTCRDNKHDIDERWWSIWGSAGASITLIRKAWLTLLQYKNNEKLPLLWYAIPMHIREMKVNYLFYK